MRNYADSRVCRDFAARVGNRLAGRDRTNALVYGTNSADCALQAVPTKPLILRKNAVTKLRLFWAAFKIGRLSKKRKTRRNIFRKIGARPREEVRPVISLLIAVKSLIPNTSGN
jgi:hypothetical protein